MIVIGLMAGVIARFLLPGPNNPQGFVLTAALGIAGAFLSTWIGQSIGWYRPDQGAGLIGATIGAIIVLVIWHRLAVQRVVTDPGVAHRLVATASLTLAAGVSIWDFSMSSMECKTDRAASPPPDRVACRRRP